MMEELKMSRRRTMEVSGLTTRSEATQAASPLDRKLLIVLTFNYMRYTDEKFIDIWRRN